MRAKLLEQLIDELATMGISGAKGDEKAPGLEITKVKALGDEMPESMSEGAPHEEALESPKFESEEDCMPEDGETDIMSALKKKYAKVR